MITELSQMLRTRSLRPSLWPVPQELTKRQHAELSSTRRAKRQQRRDRAKRRSNRERWQR